MQIKNAIYFQKFCDTRKTLEHMVNGGPTYQFTDGFVEHGTLLVGKQLQ